MASGLESTATFKARALEMGMDETLIDALKNGGISTFGTLAFISSYQPGQSDEQPLLDALNVVLGRRPNPAETILLRRLWFESNALALSDLKQRTERVDTAEPTRLPIAERVARSRDQQARLTGVLFSPENEPSHKLVDAVFQMIADQQIVWLPWEKLTSRSSEIVQSKHEMAINFDASGSLKLTKKSFEASCPLTGDINIRKALSRRALAFDLANLISFGEMEKWHEYLFALMQRTPPAGLSHVTMQQVREADKLVFTKIAEETRGSVAMQPGGDKPCEKSLIKFSEHAEIHHLMIPLPSRSRPGPYDVSTNPGDGPKGKGKKERINPRTNPMILGVRYLKAVHGSRLTRSPYVEHLIVASVPMPRRARGAAGVSMCAGNALSRQHIPHAHIRDYPVKGQITHQGSSCIPSLRSNLLRS